MRSHIDSEALQKAVFSLLYHFQFTPKPQRIAKTLLYRRPPSGMPPDGTAGGGRKSAFQNGACWPIAAQCDTARLSGMDR
jgi:hypothetical protein